MPRKSKTDVELGWLRAVWEQAAAMEMTHATYFTITIRPAATRNMFSVVMEMKRPATKNGLGAFAYSTVLRYPNGDNTQFLPWLWGKVERFGDECALADTAVADLQKKMF